MSGLINLGNTCYINSVLQLLHSLEELNQYLSDHEPNKNVVDSIFIQEWNNLRQIMDKNVTISPKRFIHMNKILCHKKNKMEFMDNQQCDASEYFTCVLDCIHNSYNKIEDHNLKYNKNKHIKQYEKNDHSIVTSLFLSMLEVTYCEKEDVLTTNYEPQWNMDLAVPDKPQITLYDCLNEYFKDEYLKDGNMWYDEKEKIKKEVIKRCTLFKCPSILVLNLKRWSSFTKKNNKRIDLETYLDLSKYAYEKANYELFGIINHDGNMYGGHYYSFIKKQGMWYNVDDELISVIPFERVVSSSNYCLFYRKLK